MKRFSATEIGGLILGGFLFLGGLDSVIWPSTGLVPDVTNDALGFPKGTAFIIMGTAGARIYGLVAILFGAVIGAMAIYRQK
jgi:hypothetical protein